MQLHEHVYEIALFDLTVTYRINFYSGTNIYYIGTLKNLKWLRISQCLKPLNFQSVHTTHSQVTVHSTWHRQ